MINNCYSFINLLKEKKRDKSNKMGYEGDEVEYEGDSDDEVVYMDENDETLIKGIQNVFKVIHTRTLKRDSYDGEALFTVELKNGMVDENFPFRSLVVPDVVIHEDMVITLKRWAKKAKEYPHNKRNCLITNERTKKGTLFSEEHQYYQEALQHNQ